MQFMLLFSRQGKLRLQKWYVPLSDKEKKKITRELVQTVLARKPKMCSFLEWRDLKIVYKRYASLYFCCAIEDQDNELITLEIIHRYVELLDKYFGSVCELDIIFNFEKAYFILDEFLLGGEVQETSKKNVLKAIEQADLLQEVCVLATCTGGGRFSPSSTRGGSALCNLWSGACIAQRGISGAAPSPHPQFLLATSEGALELLCSSIAVAHPQNCSFV
ncbi:AP-1 complex subunit sigma-2 isoform X6 [Gopherus evgoodei]|nr:AP-1 complex subunit sigma-2 isoform X6 [Gopherus evgoodei]